MLKLRIFALIFAASFSTPAFAEEVKQLLSGPKVAEPTFQETSSFGSFVIETDDDSARESLDRISGGAYDLGFSMPSQSYESEHHGSPDPEKRGKSIY